MEILQEIWSELGTRVRAFVGSRVKDPHAADDITQDVMLKVQGQLDSMPAGDKLPAWMFAIARNAVIDHYRASAVRAHADLGTEDHPADNNRDDTAARDLAPCLLRMVEHLPEPYRQAMRLVDFDGVSQQELADRAGISLSGAKSRVQRAREQLREMLHHCCDIERDGRGGVADFDRTERSARYCGDGAGEPQCGG